MYKHVEDGHDLFQGTAPTSTWKIMKNIRIANNLAEIQTGKTVNTSEQPVTFLGIAQRILLIDEFIHYKTYLGQ
jgi:hypothetical protein